MLFTSLPFIVFFSALFVLHWTVPHAWRKPLLLAASYCFYGAWDWRFTALLAFTTVFDFLCARLIYGATTAGRKKSFLLLSLGANLSVLAFFKYFNFFVDSFCRLLGIDNTLGLSIILPVGVSFFTFQSMSYTIDVYRGRIKPAGLLDYFLFVSFFPQLIAGPIVRASQFLPQEKQGKDWSFTDLGEGLMLFLRGFVKKVLFADLLARSADPIFANPEAFSASDCMLALYAFTFQIYWDFSGYTDMARGAARLLGYDLPINFNLPYISRSFSEFWRRWHISLSTWLRDYLYIGLGGNRRGTALAMRNVFITMALGGLWHGAQWHFVLWGMYHGCLLIGERALRLIVLPVGLFISTPFTVLRRILVFHAICAGWLLFRCSDMAHVLRFAGSIMSGAWQLNQSQILLAGALTGFMLWEIISALAESNRIRSGIVVTARSILCGAGVAAAFLYSTSSTSFLYFQF